MTKKRILASPVAGALLWLAGCSGQPPVEKEIVQSEPAPIGMEERSEPDRLVGSSHQEESEWARVHAGLNAASAETSAASESRTASQRQSTINLEKEIAPPEGFKLAKAVDNAGRGVLFLVIPRDWKATIPKSAMRILEIRLPAPKNGLEDGEIAVFGPMGGSVQANIDRWIGQVAQPDGSSSKDKAIVESIEGDEFPFTFVDVSGVYSGMMGQGAPKGGYRLLGCILTTPVGPWFLKAVGPADTLERWKEAFVQACKNARLEVTKTGGGAGSP